MTPMTLRADAAWTAMPTASQTNATLLSAGAVTIATRTVFQTSARSTHAPACPPRITTRLISAACHGGRIDDTVAFQWGMNTPWPDFGSDTFSVRWTGFVVTPAVSGTYTFHTTTDDGVRLWIDEQLVVEHWDDQAPAEWSGTIDLNAVRAYTLTMEFYENAGGAVAELRWQPPGMAKEIIPAANLLAGRDCDGNLVVDACDVAGGALDSNANGIPDQCDPNYALNIVLDGSGDVIRDPNAVYYVEGTLVDVMANAEPGWMFDHWEGDLTGSTNPDALLMDGPKTVTAVFVADQYSLTVNVTGQGTVALDPNDGTYTYGQNVTLTANAEPGWMFDHWEGDLTGSTNPDALLMDAPKTVTAVFVADQYSLTVNVTGQGTVALDPNDGTYTYGQNVTLTANAEPGWMFDHWEGDLTGSTNPDALLMDAPKTVTAVFVADQYSLTVNVTGQGTVALDPNDGTYTYGQNVTLTANAEPGWTFDHWEGDLTGSTNPDSILMDGSKTVTAVFVVDQYSLTVNVTGQGTVALDPNDGTYTYGQNVTLTANAEPGWMFDHWEGDLTGSTNPDALLMDGPKTVTAVFVADQYSLTVNVTGQGTVALDPNDGTYTYGQNVTLTANAEPGWMFDHWEGDLTGSDNPNALLITGPLTVTAVFVVDQPCIGDLDGDNTVGLEDLQILLANYGVLSDAQYEDGDLDGDGDVDLSDVQSLLSHYGMTC